MVKDEVGQRCGGAGVTSKGNAVSFGNDQIIEIFLGDDCEAVYTKILN